MCSSDLTDAAGNSSVAASTSFTLDTQVAAPTVMLLTDSGSSSSDQLSNVGTLSVSGNEASALVEYSPDNASWSSTPPAVTQGANTVYVRQIDLAGNVSTATAFSFTFDNQVAAPTVALSNDSGVSNSDKISNDGTLTISGLETGAQVEYSSNNASWSSTAPTLSQGANTIYVRQIDRAGNISSATAFSFTYDNQISAPTVEIGRAHV